MPETGIVAVDVEVATVTFEPSNGARMTTGAPAATENGDVTGAEVVPLIVCVALAV